MIIFIYIRAIMVNFFEEVLHTPLLPSVNQYTLSPFSIVRWRPGYEKPVRDLWNNIISVLCGGWKEIWHTATVL